ncbi:MAG: transglycosylase SLT domain-containing protein [Methylococcaceae bacterium]
MNLSRKFIPSSLKMANPLSIRERRAEPEKSCYAQCLLFLVLLLPFSGWSQFLSRELPQLEKIRLRGELRFVTVTTDDAAPLEHELARLFARRLGVQAHFDRKKPGFRLDRVMTEDEADIAVGIFPHTQSVRLSRQGPVHRQAGQVYAWALSRDEDVSLYTEVRRFFREIRADKRLEQLTDRYNREWEGAVEPDQDFHRDYRKRLPRLKRWFVRAGHDHDLDWRLLAAVSYQESRWEQQAVSPEGVRGLMMLTQATARQFKIKDRTDPATSILGAAAYLRQTLDNFPPEILNPDRTWYALAAYNLGYTHIKEARDRVQKQGGNPNMWIEIRTVLPFMNKLPHRGSVTVNYVHRIREYYDRLIGLTENRLTPPTTAPADSGSV